MPIEDDAMLRKTIEGDVPILATRFGEVRQIATVAQREIDELTGRIVGREA